MTQQTSGTSHELILQISKDIRRTLDINAIRQQTVNQLGQALDLQRCLLCSYSRSSQRMPVVAEYHQDSLPSMRGVELQLQTEPYLHQALTTLEPIVVDYFPAHHDWQRQSLLIIATAYQNQPNGLIYLQQCKSQSPPLSAMSSWQPEEIELVQEIAEQVGTALAYANLYQNNAYLSKQLREARQQVREAYRLKSRFLASFSEQLRHPLNGILGSLQLLIDDLADDPQEQQDFIEEAYRSAIHLTYLFNNILDNIVDFSQIKNQKIKLELGEPVVLTQLLIDIERFSRPQIIDKQLTWQLIWPENFHDIVLYGNTQWLLRVLRNLVGNATKYTHDGGVTIKLSILPKPVKVHDIELPGMLKIEIIDTGIGVPLEYQAKIFEPFFQMRDLTTHRHIGTGIGLTISKKLVEAMGGQIYFYSAGEDMGSTVTFTVPLYPVGDECKK
jgi:signal transduction histidine kinase